MAKVLVGVFFVILWIKSWVSWLVLVASLSEENNKDEDEDELGLGEEDVCNLEVEDWPVLLEGTGASVHLEESVEGLSDKELPIEIGS